MGVRTLHDIIFFFKQKTAYEILASLEFRRVLFRSISDAEVDGRTVRVSVRFTSDLISATRNKAGQVVEGDPTAVQNVRDVWTFARDATSRDPNWKLVATEAV